MFKKPASDHPGWTSTTMWQSWKICCEFVDRADYCNPDLFGMYIYNDGGRGIVDFNKEWRRKRPNLKIMWAIMAGMMHWLRLQRDDWTYDDDGEGTAKPVELVGCAFLTALNEIDRRAELKPDSEFRDLTLVMAIFVDWAKYQDNVLEMGKDPGWWQTAVAYAKQKSIDLSTAPFPGAAKLMAGLEDEDIEPLEGDAKVDRWEWKAKFKEFESHHGKCYGRGDKPKLGGTQHDITKMSRSERASYAFDHRDPLAHLPPKDIKAGGLVLR